MSKPLFEQLLCWFIGGEIWMQFCLMWWDDPQEEEVPEVSQTQEMDSAVVSRNLN